MSKGLEELESIISTFYNKDREDIKIVEKELKALEIIKSDKELIKIILDYVSTYGMDTYTRYKLLKEVLL